MIKKILKTNEKKIFFLVFYQIIVEKSESVLKKMLLRRF
jgi:hypothetical protein